MKEKIREGEKGSRKQKRGKNEKKKQLENRK